MSTSGSISHRVNNYINTRHFCRSSSDQQRYWYRLGTPPNDQADVDLSLSKTFQVRWPKEGAGLGSGDLFNALNHPNFAGEQCRIFNHVWKITATSTNPRVIQLALSFSF